MNPSATPDSPPDPAAERLSALMDGQAAGAGQGPASTQDWSAACQEWADSPACRQRWHAYHLIGDALRSQELAAAPEHDAAFLATFRQRLAAEPVVLAPAPLLPTASAPQPAASRRLGWAAPAAVAAGFMAVAGVLVVLRAPAPEPAALVAQPAARSAPGAAVSLVNASAAPQAGSAPMIVVNGQMIRDARLDRYLAAHRGPAQGASLTAPGVVVHGVVDLNSGDGK